MRKIAIIFGGHSTEYEVSLQSAAAVFENINTEEFEVFPIGITKAGDWYHYTGELSKIAAGTWCNDASHLNCICQCDFGRISLRMILYVPPMSLLKSACKRQI